MSSIELQTQRYPITASEDVYLHLTFTNDDDTIRPMDTGNQLWLSMNKKSTKFTDPDIQIQYDLPATGTDAQAALGEVVIELPSTLTVDLSRGYKFELAIFTPDEVQLDPDRIKGEKTVVETGVLYFRDSVLTE